MAGSEIAFIMAHYICYPWFYRALSCFKGLHTSFIEGMFHLDQPLCAHYTPNKVYLTTFYFTQNNKYKVYKAATCRIKVNICSLHINIGYKAVIMNIIQPPRGTTC